MVRLGKVLLVLAISVYAVSSAAAQRPGGGGRGGMDPTRMLTENKQLQEELKLDKEQIEKIKAAVEKVHTDLKADVATSRDRDAPREEQMAARKKVQEATTKALETVLKPEQTKRLQQIERQLAGVRLFQQEKVQEALKLTDEQKEKIKGIADESGKKGRELFQGGGRGPEVMEKMQAIQKEAMESAVKTLDDSQKKALKDLVGEPFHLQRTPRPAAKKVDD